MFILNNFIQHSAGASASTLKHDNHLHLIIIKCIGIAKSFSIDYMALYANNLKYTINY